MAQINRYPIHASKRKENFPKRLMLQLGFCLTLISFCLYSYLNKQNELTQVKICLPQLEKDIKIVSEENCRLQYEIDRVENPMRLIELVHRPEFSNFKHPVMKEILSVPEGVAVKADSSSSNNLW